jgi:hypothetical protein
VNRSRRRTIYVTAVAAANREPHLNETFTESSPARELRGRFRAAVRRRTITGLCAVTVLASGCGGGDRQDKGEKSATYNVDVVTASFPAKQRLARQERMVVEVRNADTKTIPNVAVTVEPGFTTRSNRQDLADPNRPVWIVDDGPIGGGTAYTNTWALGALKAGETRKFVWKVTPVQSGSHEVRFRVAAGLNGKAKAQGQGGNAAEGSFDVTISPKPAQATVDPDTGEVIRDDGPTK